MENKAPAPTHQAHTTSVTDTIQSLIVAFVLAMMFRGFVTEGFVIPTGSMAPTLMGRHALVRSPQTGADFPVGLDQTSDPVLLDVGDPMLGPAFPHAAFNPRPQPARNGDRILVIKSLYPFAAPNRFDVVVFKTPVTPIGDSSNYIKRLIGLPNEQIWLVDGDVFARDVNQDDFRVQRKPEHVQRAVWQMVHHSDHVPINTDRLHDQSRPGSARYQGPPWTGANWDTTGRTYRCETTELSVLEWDQARRSIDDWAAYNMLALQVRMLQMIPVSDVRVSAAVTADQPGLGMNLELRTRDRIFEFAIEDGAASISVKGVADAPAELHKETAWRLPKPGRPFNVEFWHVDQSMKMFVDGRKILELDYEWSPIERLRNATGDVENDDPEELNDKLPKPPQIRWSFSGSPVTLQRVRVDRDLYYRTTERGIYGRLFGAHPQHNPAILGPDQFMMLGDNSQMSEDSRRWGHPHRLVAETIDAAPFVVNRKLLIGKAWLVYFPAMYSVKQGGSAFVPDFGRMRFIR